MQWTSDTLIAGHVALDFLNTMSGKGRARTQDHLPDWRAALEWAAATGLITPEDQAALLSEVSVSAADKAHGLILHVRAMAYAVFSAHAQGSVAAEPVLETLTAMISEARKRARLERDAEGGLAWRIPATPPGPDMLALRLALAFDDLIVARGLTRLRQCGRCSWLFLDTGRGRGRRWCRMAVCGNRAKVERHRKQYLG